MIKYELVSYRKIWPEMNEIWELEHRIEAQGVDSKAQLAKELYFRHDVLGSLQTLIAKDKDKLIGYVVSFILQNNPFKGDTSAHTAFYYLLQFYRTQGIGKQMIQLSEDMLRRKGVDYIYFSTKSHLNYTSMFKHFGYDECEITMRKKL